MTSKTKTPTVIHTPASDDLVARFTAGSLASRLAQLEIGESIAECRKIQRKEMASYDRSAEHRRIDATVGSAIQRVRVKLDFEFETDRIAVVTTSGDVVIGSLVTRIS